MYVHGGFFALWIVSFMYYLIALEICFLTVCLNTKSKTKQYEGLLVVSK